MELKLERRVIASTPDVWTRTDGKEISNKHPELFVQIGLILKKPFDRSEWKVDKRITGEGAESWQCVCSKTELSVPFIVSHVSGEKFLIGSSCINKFGNEELDKEVRAHQRANKCAGGNVILDLRTHEGKLGYCAEPMCRCRGPKCSQCHVLEDECTCPRCAVCTKVVCVCPRCSQCRKLETECTCPRCADCTKVVCVCPKCKICAVKTGPNGECPCEQCVFCDEYPNKCTCKTCSFCKKKMQLCKCKKCIICRESLSPDLPSWKTVCEWCFVTAKTCVSCSRTVPESWKTHCFQCFKNLKKS